MYLLYNNSRKLGVYIHVPFCRRRCIYCDFYFEIGQSRSNFETCVLQEYEARKPDDPQNPNTLYFGGGTPSLLSPQAISKLISGLGLKTQEITLEANPEDLSPEYLAQIREAGVNRLSLGVQSLEDNILQFLGRKHRANQAKQAILDAKKAGFQRISIDLIIGVRAENLDYLNWFREQNIGHLSVYLLTVEPQTPLYHFIQKGRLKAPCEDQQADAYIDMQDKLSRLGYEQYEISSYALPGQESHHNRIYWSGGDYLGLGPGAHSKKTHQDGSITRRHTHALLTEWQQNPSQARFKEESLNPQEALLESLAFGIRDLKRGISVAQPTPEFQSLMQAFIAQNWITRSDQSYQLTPIGARFADAVAREILGLEWAK